jgi:glycosyltransferase involved in cell wall biosynthesis
MPSVSIILPTYNRSNLLDRSIKSVLDQTCKDFELIIVDDCSCDSTEKLVSSFNDERINYIRHKENKGVAAARNTGLQFAKGTFIAFQDDDDEWLPDKLEKQVKCFENTPEAGIIYTATMVVKGNRKRFVPCFQTRNKRQNIISNIAEYYFLTLQATLIKRECFEKTGSFDEQFPVFEDWDMLFRLGRYYQFKGINEPLVIRHIHPKGLSQNLTGIITGYKRLIEKNFDDIKKDKELLAHCYLKLGHMLCFQGEINEGRIYLLRSIKSHPLDIRGFAAFCLSLSGKKIYATATKSFRSVRGVLLS